MIFFLSIGLLIDIPFIAANALHVLLILCIVVFAKTVFNAGVLRVAGQPWAHAVITGILLAQIGEFSFVLGTFGIDRGVIDPDDGNLIIAVTALSLVISPLWLLTARRLLRIGIVGVTSGRETLRLFLGRFASSAVWSSRGQIGPKFRQGGEPASSPCALPRDNLFPQDPGAAKSEQSAEEDTKPAPPRPAPPKPAPQGTGHA